MSAEYAKKINRVGIIYKQNQKSLDLGNEIIKWFEQKKINSMIFPNPGEEESHNGFYDNKTRSEGFDLVIVLGGDGTFISAARNFAGMQVPLLGINTGTLGFLTEISLEETFDALELVIDGQYDAIDRTMLRAEIIEDDQKTAFFDVLNDVVVNRSYLARIIDFSVYVDGQFLSSFRGDGLIVATPTGSTAYNLAAGGPIVHPLVPSILIVPICPFTLSNRPILVSDNSTIEVTFDPKVMNLRLTGDGQVGKELKPEHRIVIRRSPLRFRFIQSPFKDYFQILRTKLGWGGN